MKRTISLVLTGIILCSLCFGLSGCGHTCTNIYPTCTEDAVCYECNKLVASALGHDFSEATCTEDAICARCGETGESATGHNFENGICTECSYENPYYFNPQKYGFENNYDMTTLIEISSYSAEDGTVTYQEYGKQHYIYTFKDNVLYDCRRFEDDTSAHKYYATRTRNYQIINNDCITADGNTYTILDRITLPNNNVIIKLMINSSTTYFVLDDQIDWSKSPEVNSEAGAGRQKFTYYFKD